MTEAKSVPPLLPWQTLQWRIVSDAFRQERLSHALLLAGPAGVGKRQFAWRLACAMLCDEHSGDPCGQCPSCRQMMGGAHPGFSVLQREPDKRDIAIDAVRELCASLAMTSHDGRAKVAIIDPVDALNQNGVNALLKTLEEPSAGSLLLLVSERPMALPATLRSRCQTIRFGLPDVVEAMVWLRARHGDITAVAREQALQLAGGAPLQAGEYLADEQALPIFAQWDRLMNEITEDRADSLQVAGAVKREQASMFLAWLNTWIHGRLRNAPTGAIAAPLAQFGEAATDALRRLQGNANPQLLVESLLIGWSGTLARARRDDYTPAEPPVRTS